MTYRRKEGVSVRKLGQELMLYDSVTDRVHVLNETGAFIWELLDGKNTAEDIEKILKKKFQDVPDKNISKDMQEIIRKLKKEGLITPVSKMNIAERVNLANQLFMKGDVDTAIKEYGSSLSLKPDDQIIKENLALALTAKKRLDEAEELLKENPNSDSSCNLLGNIYFFRKDYGKAKGYYEKALELNSNLGDAWSNLGNVHLELKNYSMSEDCYRRAIRISGDNPYWHSNLGKALLMQGKVELAVESYKKCLAVNPKLRDIQRALCIIYDKLVGEKLSLIDYIGAYSLYRECRNICPDIDLSKYPNLCRSIK